MFKVLITSAGLGSRLGDLCKNLNKSLLAINHKPVISHIIEKFPVDVPIVVALGYKADLVRQYLQIAHHDRNFTFVEVHNFSGPGSGLGLTLLECKDYLQCPFVFCSNDTIVDEAIPEPTEDWIGYENNRTDSPSQYRTLQIKDGMVSRLLDKTEREFGVFPYIGLAGIHDYKSFWTYLTYGKGHGAIEIGESYALREMIGQGRLSIKALPFIWYDTGNVQSLTRIQNQYKSEHNILPKEDEAIWFVNGLTVKYFANKETVTNKVARAQYLRPYVPDDIGYMDNMFGYSFIRGKVASSIMTVPLLKDLLETCESMWDVGNYTSSAYLTLKDACRKFYQMKTYDRVVKFRQTDKKEIINGQEIPGVYELLEQVPWMTLEQNCVPAMIHGDLHNENIILSENGKWCFIDWREDFAGEVCGDLQYDLAKLAHGLQISHPLVNAGHFDIKENDGVVTFDIHRSQKLVECEEFFWGYIQNKLIVNVKNVKILTALIYLNIACLHEKPYGTFLWYFGKYNLWKILNES